MLPRRTESPVPAPERLPSPKEREQADAAFAVVKRTLQRRRSGSLRASGTLQLADLPEPAVRLLVGILDQLRRGRAVTLVPHGAELTTQQAADFLGVSRPYVVKLVETGKLPARRVGPRRRVRFEDLVVFQQKDRQERDKLLDALTTDFELEGT